MSPKTKRTRTVYQAEWEAFPDSGKVDFRSISSAQKWVDEIVASSFWQNAEGPRHVKVRDHGEHDECYADVGRQEIWMSSGMLTRRIVLHELAHLLADPKAEDHGCEFIQAYLALLEEFLGTHYSRVLVSTLKKHRVKC